MKYKILSFVSALILCAVAVGCSAPSNPKAEQAALDAASAWLELLDEGRYIESWDETSELFKKVVTKDQWEESLKGIREPLGKVVSRKLNSAQYAEELPGVPDGQYVMLQYQTSLEFKKSSIESVTPMLDRDGKWRVSGYYIK